MSTTLKNSLPVGSILAYATEQPADVSQFPIEWQFCHGAKLDKTEYPQLFAAIGYCNGKDPENANLFYLPDFRGVFLRGVDPTGTVDVDVKSRKPQGIDPTPDQVLDSAFIAEHHPGSIQEYATARPRNCLAVKFRVPGQKETANFTLGGSGVSWLIRHGSGVGRDVQFKTKESVPVNTYMHYIIKIKPSYTVPVGSVIAFGGSDSKTPDPALGNWASCDGKNARTDTSAGKVYASLATVLDGRYGASPDKAEFVLPDLQGMFVRGVDNEDPKDQRDKNLERKQPLGITGPYVPTAGSVQRSGTGQPIDRFQVGILRFGGTVDGLYYNTNPSNPIVRAGGTTDQQWSGGDLETRPVNAYVQFLISLSEFTTVGSGIARTKKDPTPIGTIISIPGPQPAPGGFYETWLPCDGEAYSTTDYPGLFVICQYNWGRTPNSVPSHDDDFRVPNLQGQFLRGVDHKPASQAIDPDRSSRVDSDGSSFAGTGSYQNYATSLSGASIETGYNGAIPVALTLAGNSVARYVDDLVDVEVVGGDKETRPINVAVHFYIKHAT